MEPTDPTSQRIELSCFQVGHEQSSETFIIYRQSDLPQRNGGGLKKLLDRCYPKPPRDVFERMLSLYKPGDPVYTMEHDGQTVGMVYCVRHSKGGHLESLAIDPDYQGLGLADRLVKTLVQDNPGFITLTTRIPRYFERLGFKVLETLSDESVLMATRFPA